ncbi:hypothetical protein G5I_12419 [Acromyrmex echinatior]|uniref:Uncharacterized protein n=1 Tax=Acromyrmex echinatior TaxID=103372 RepID=F4X297_ACREC|nr:hypothetical protein G5I_12419 [Acromyrmex echinatior]
MKEVKDVLKRKRLRSKAKERQAPRPPHHATVLIAAGLSGGEGLAVVGAVARRVLCNQSCFGASENPLPQHLTDGITRAVSSLLSVFSRPCVVRHDGAYLRAWRIISYRYRLFSLLTLPARQGKAKRGEARRGETRRGEARQGKARQGKARRGETRVPSLVDSFDLLLFLVVTMADDEVLFDDVYELCEIIGK